MRIEDSDIKVGFLKSTTPETGRGDVKSGFIISAVTLLRQYLQSVFVKLVLSGHHDRHHPIGLPQCLESHCASVLEIHR